MSEIDRYQRHIALSEIGPEGHAKIRAARVLIVGLGGLGCPAALYLAASGVGSLTLMDADRVDESNLPRQILFGSQDVGQPKARVAQERLAAAYPDCDIQASPDRLDVQNALDKVSRFDIVIEASDNFATKFLVNDACALAEKPWVYGGLLANEGQTALFAPAAPCYRCLFDAPPPAGSVSTCRQAGILGPVAGVIGSLQAVAALRWISGSRPEKGQTILTIFDASTSRFRTVAFKKRSRCPLCGVLPKIEALEDAMEDYQTSRA